MQLSFISSIEMDPVRYDSHMTSIKQPISPRGSESASDSRTSDFSLTALELLMATAMCVIPLRLRWSHRSSTLLRIVGITLAVTRVLPTCSAGPLSNLLGRLTRNCSALAGMSLIGGQYQLTEEESAVRGVIAAVGATLLALGFLRRKSAHNSELPGSER